MSETKKGKARAPAEPTATKASADTTPEELLAIVNETLEEKETAYITLNGCVRVDR